MNETAITIDLPFPPTVNTYWRHVGAKVLISREGREYRKIVVTMMALSLIRPLDGRLAVEILVHPPDRRRRDVDNLCKSLLDALKYGGAYHDDSQIDDLRIRRQGVVKGGLAKVFICQKN